jgi:hypothetical protein
MSMKQNLVHSFILCPICITQFSLSPLTLSPVCMAVAAGHVSCLPSDPQHQQHPQSHPPVLVCCLRGAVAHIHGRRSTSCSKPPPAMALGPVAIQLHYLRLMSSFPSHLSLSRSQLPSAGEHRWLRSGGRLRIWKLDEMLLGLGLSSVFSVQTEKPNRQFGYPNGRFLSFRAQLQFLFFRNRNKENLKKPT